MVRCDGLNTEFDDTVASFVSSDDRLLAYFASPEDHERIKTGGGGSMARDLQLQTVKQWELQDVSPSVFAYCVEETKAALKKTQSDLGQQYHHQDIATGNDRLKQKYGDTFELKVSGTEFLGYFGESDDTLGFTSILNYAEKSQKRRRSARPCDDDGAGERTAALFQRRFQL